MIDAIREEVNKTDWTFSEYTNKNNRNKWNCICSAMDWITVASEYLETHPLRKLSTFQSMDLYTSISCVDLIVEAVEQLHRVIFNTKQAVFEKDRDCFPNNQFQQCDREYFKTLRACFGAHPVNLDDPEDANNKTAKRFASWSTQAVGIGDFTVVLYSNKVDGKNIFLGISFLQLEAFAEKYYNHLNELKDALHQQFVEFCEKMRKEIIIAEGTPIERLQILKEECKKRLNNDYYMYTIEELINTFQTPITCQQNKGLVDEYKNALLNTIDEIQRNLQNMELLDLSIDSVYPKSLPIKNGWAYWVEKLNSTRIGTGYPSSLWIDGIRDCFGKYFVFEYSSYQELYVLVEATIFKLKRACQE